MKVGTAFTSWTQTAPRVRTSTYSSSITETSSYHPSKGLVPQLPEKSVNWPPSHLTKYQEPSIDSQRPLQSFIDLQSLAGVCKENLVWGHVHLPTSLRPAPHHLYSRSYYSWSWATHDSCMQVLHFMKCRHLLIGERVFFWGVVGNVGSFI